MRRSSHLGRALGITGGVLLLGPLVYALTLPAPRLVVPKVFLDGEACPADAPVEPAPEPPVEPAP
ncbi:MAG: hypothetical protein KC457_28915, partial [Myxococcales bacterium]|nr:hypothetical protein [Myxococcales bacterium]